MSYYVNSESDQAMELGTKAYPYKDLSFVFVEILNYHAHSNRNITVYLKESTANYLSIDNNYIVNVTQVSIETYSDDAYKDPESAIIIGVDNKPLVPHPGTQYSILSAYDLKVDEMILSNDGITETEKIVIEGSDALIYVQRSSFRMHNLVIDSNYKTRANSNILIYPLYLQDKTVILSKSEFKVQGTVMIGSHPLNLLLENLDVDLARSSGGFDITVSCGYPEAVLNGLVNISNFTIHFGSEREVYPFKYLSFRYEGPASLQVTDLTVSIFGLSQEYEPTFYFLPAASCVPDYYQRFYNFTNLNLVPGTFNGMINMLGTNFGSDVYVQNILTINNWIMKSDFDEYVIIYILGYYTTEVYVDKVFISESQAHYFMIVMMLFSKVELVNVVVESTLI